MLMQELRGASQLFRIKAIEFHIVFENDDVFRPGLQPFAQAEHVRVVYALLHVGGMALPQDELDAVRQPHFRELLERRFAAVIPLPQGMQ